MKKLLLLTITTFFSILFIIIFILSSTGYETEKFNKVISDKVNKIDNNISLQLEKIKFKFDLKDLSLFLETQNPKLVYHDVNLPIKNVKLYVDLFSLIKSKPKIEKANISLKQIDINKLKKIIIKTKPSSFNSFIINQVRNGKLTSNIEVYFDNNQKINNFITKGKVKEVEAVIKNNLILQNTSFNFFADKSDILIKDIKSKMNGLLIKEGNLRIDRNKVVTINSDFLTEIDINKKNINNYSSYLKNYKLINQDIVLKANLNHNFNIVFDDTFKVTDYTYKSNGKILNASFKLQESLKSFFLENNIDKLKTKDSDLNVRFSSDKKNYIKVLGLYQLNDLNYQSFGLKNSILDKGLNVDLNFEFSKKIKIDLINYKKNKNIISKISSNFNLIDDLIHFKKIEYKENKNLILIEDLKIQKDNIISLKKIKVKTFSENKIKNDFTIKYQKKIKINGKTYDATNLNKIFNQNSKNNILKKISKEIDIDFENIQTSLPKELKNFKLIGTINKGEFVKISSKGDFGNNKYLDISLKSNKNNNKKYLEIYSDLPQAILSEYSFFKGLSEGKLMFSSVIEEDLTNSKLVINQFKIIDAPGVVKLLSLADFGGLADLASGDGLSFEKLEIKMSANKKFIKLEELYAVGPSISVLMEGYKEDGGLISLKGTLVPAKNLNKILSKIPVIGNIIIPQEIGEGLFGVSFKMKGQPGKIRTTINPIKTLTPRFITKALEKSKKSKKSK